MQKAGAKNRARSMKQRKGTKIDLTAFYSARTKEPSKEKHDKMIISPQGQININTKVNTEKFEADCDCIYFSFYSVSGCTVWLQAEFREPLVRKIDNKKAKGQDTEDMDE